MIVYIIHLWLMTNMTQQSHTLFVFSLVQYLLLSKRETESCTIVTPFKKEQQTTFSLFKKNNTAVI